MKYLTGQPEKGKKYRIEHNGEQLYDASIVEHDGGCWAKVKIENTLPSKMEKHYKEGMEFDIKLGYYNLLIIEE
jgi:hypothetical protein